MLVRMLVSRASASGADNVGDVIEVDDAEGGRMIAAGQAEPASPPQGRTPARRAETRESKHRGERR